MVTTYRIGQSASNSYCFARENYGERSTTWIVETCLSYNGHRFLMKIRGLRYSLILQETAGTFMEMNIFSPQSYEAESELRYLTSTQNNIISAQESKPIISITQDSLIGLFLMTKKVDFTLTRTQFFDICTKGKRVDGTELWNPQRVKHIEKILKIHKISTIYNGYGLFSLLLPQNFNYEKKNNLGTITIIKEGVLVSGVLDKSILGASQGSIIQLLNKEYGVPTVANFIDNAQFISNAWLLVHGFSIGIEDCMVTSEKSISTINETLAQCYATTEAIEQQTINPHIREARVIASLDQAVNVGLRIAKEAMNPTNNFLTTIYSGAKGEMFNIAQLTGLLSQQKIEDHRIVPTLTHGKRTLVHYPIDEKISKEREYESRGFIRHSFIHGLTPEEFFFHAMSGRVSCTDTSLSTSRSGYLQRRIIKCCEDIQIQYDRTVRDCSGRIYQFSYGQNNLDPFTAVRVEEKPFFCDMKRLASQLNTSHELKLSREINAPKLHKLTYNSITEKMPLKIVTPAPVIQPKVPIILEEEEKDEEKEDLESEIDNIQDTDNEDENDENEDEEKEGDEEDEKEEKEEEEEILSDIDSEDFNVEEAFSEYGGDFD